MNEIKLGDVIEFGQGDEANTTLRGVVTRVWPNGKYVTALVDGTSTYCRLIGAVKVVGYIYPAAKCQHGNFTCAICGY